MVTTRSQGRRGPPAKKKARTEKAKKQDCDILRLIQPDIWAGQILPFLGPGNFVFLALVCKQFKQLYEEYFVKLDPVPQLGCHVDEDTIETRRACVTDTLFSNVFSNLNCTQWWDRITREMIAENLQSGREAESDEGRAPLSEGDIRGLNRTDVFTAAAKYGDMEVIKWMHQNGFEWNVDVCSEAAAAGNLELLKYLHVNGCPWEEFTCTVAAEKGHLKVLQYLHEEQCPWNKSTCSEAAKHGHLEVLRYAHENGCPWGSGTTMYAAMDGRLETLKYAHQEGCPWDERTPWYAASNGHLETLKYAHENGCPWDCDTAERAAKHGHLEIVKYAHENGCPWDCRTAEAAAEQGHLEILEYVAGTEGNYPRPSILPTVALRGHLEVLKWLHQQKFPWDEEACKMAAYGKQKEVLDYLIDNGCPGAEKWLAYMKDNGGR